MMNKIYDFDVVREISTQQKKLVYSYIWYTILFVVALIIACVSINSNVLLTVVFAVLLLCFIFGSILFWKIKYGIIKDYKVFLDNMETGNKEDFVGEYIEMFTAADEDTFDVYIFDFASKKVSFLVHKQHSLELIKGKKYHLEHVGKYIYRWETVK